MFYLKVHPWIQCLDGPGFRIQSGKAVYKMGAKSWVNVFWSEFTQLRAVVSPGAPITYNLAEASIYNMLLEISDQPSCYGHGL